MKRYIPTIILLLSLAGCDIPQEGYRPGYISAYYYFDPHDIKVIYESDSFSIDLQYYSQPGDMYSMSHSYVFDNNQMLADRYYGLCEKFGDISAEGFLCSNLSGGLMPRASFEIVRSISVTSNTYWGTEHPTGALLNDLFSITYYTYYPYIKNYYTGQICTPVTKPLSELQNDEMKLIDNHVILNCHTLPTESERHTLTISFELDTDRTATYEVEIDLSNIENNA